MTFLTADLDTEQAARLGTFLSTGAVTLFLEDKVLSIKLPGGHMCITVPMEERE